MKNVIGKISTWLIFALLVATLPMDLMGHPSVVETLARLGYPAYLASILGSAKILAAIAILQPYSVRSKDWAASGLAVMFTGAAISHTVRDPIQNAAMPTICLLVLLLAYFLNNLFLFGARRHSSLKK